MNYEATCSDVHGFSFQGIFLARWLLIFFNCCFFTGWDDQRLSFYEVWARQSSQAQGCRQIQQRVVKPKKEVAVDMSAVWYRM